MMKKTFVLFGAFMILFSAAVSAVSPGPGPIETCDDQMQDLQEKMPADLRQADSAAERQQILDEYLGFQKECKGKLSPNR